MPSIQPSETRHALFRRVLENGEILIGEAARLLAHGAAAVAGDAERLADRLDPPAASSAPAAAAQPARAHALEVGDFVQWESGGVVQFDRARRVEELLGDGFVRVEGSATGIPAAELVITDPPAPSAEDTGSSAS